MAGQQPPAGRSPVHAPRAVVATSQPLATAAGLRVLWAGGNAVDAAVAAAAVLAVVEPHMTGPGGDLFAQLWWAADRRLHGLNASGRAGRGHTPGALHAAGHRRMPASGPATVTVPGAVSGWAALAERFGVLPLPRLLEEAIGHAEEGFPVSPIIARQWAALAPFLAADPGAATTFLPAGRAPAAGEWFRNPELAATLRLLAAEGAAALHEGPLGRRIVAHLRGAGGGLHERDLAEHRAEWVEPLGADFRGARVWQLPPNGQGIAVLEMLRILEPFDLAALGAGSGDYIHHLVEAKKLAFADLHRFVGDPAAMELSAERLLDDEFIAARRRLLDPRRAAPDVAAGTAPGATARSGDTVYLCTADAAGNMVSLISSIYGGFGSGVVVPGTGFALQNRGAGFTLEPGRPATLAPGRRPLHTIIPGFVTRPTGEPWLAFGVMGGPMQPQGQVQVLLELLLSGRDPQAAIDAPRWRHLDGPRLALEPGVPAAARTRLAALGHDLIDGEEEFGGAQAILRLPRGWAAGSDARKDGMAAGF
jgi:gamma-glutamyltranspeptidase / glutathione hydrolase